MAKKTKKAPDAGEARIEYRRLADVRPAKRNPKLHDLPSIKASILRHGFVAPPIEDAATGRIVAGHGRKEAVEEIRRETPDKPAARVKVDKALALATYGSWGSTACSAGRRQTPRTSPG